MENKKYLEVMKYMLDNKIRKKMKNGHKHVINILSMKPQI